MQCREIESVLENEGLSPLLEAVRAHAASCSACGSLIADFSAIVSAAGTLPVEVEPPTRVWVALRNQLEAEGIIKNTADATAIPRTSWLAIVSRILRGRGLATAAVGLGIVAAAVVLIERSKEQIVRAPGANVAQSRDTPGPPILFAQPLSATGQNLHSEEESPPILR